MAGYSLEPVTHDQAVRNMAAAMQRSKWSLFLTYLSGIAAAVALAFIADDIGAGPAWVVFLVAGGLCAAGSALSQRVLAGVRYRIVVPYGPLRLIGGLVAGIALWAGVAWLIASISDSLAPVNKILLFVVLIGVVTTYGQLSNLFTGNAQQLVFRKTRVPWNNVAHLVVVRGQGTVEIGVRTIGPVADGLPARPGEVLTDLPYRVVVLERQFDFERLAWVANQSGRTDIPIVERAWQGEQLLRYANARG